MSKEYINALNDEIDKTQNSEKRNILLEENMRRQISHLLYIQTCVSNRINQEIDEILRGRGKSSEEIKDSIVYLLDEML